MNAQFFRYVQNAPWYTHFLNPVLDSLTALPDHATILDVGTGAGKLIEMGLARYSYDWIGADTDTDMLAQARQRSVLYNTPLHPIPADGRLPLADSSVDAVVYCSVLFLVSRPETLLQEAWRVLHEGGRIVVLTPSGTAAIDSPNIQNIGLHPNNWTFFLWRRMTSGSGRRWAKQHVLAQFAESHHGDYQHQLVFNGLAQLETIDKRRSPLI